MTRLRHRRGWLSIGLIVVVTAGSVAWAQEQASAEPAVPPAAAEAAPQSPADASAPAAEQTLEAQAAVVMDVLGPTFQQTTMLGWGALLAAIFLGLLAGRLGQTLLRRVAQTMTKRSREVAATVLDDAVGPLGLSALTLGLTFGLQAIFLEPALEGFVNRVLAFLYIAAIGWFIYNLVDVVEVGIKRLTSTRSGALSAQIVPLVRKTLRVFVVVVFVLFAAQNVFGVDITAWLAGLGIAGLAVSLAAQDSIKNLFGSLTVLLDKPFVVGERIVFDGVDGNVEEIGFRSTRIRSLLGHVHTVPNMKFIDNSVENITRRPNYRRIINITITYDTPPEKVQQALQIVRGILADPEVARPFDLENFPPKAFFNDYNSESLNIFTIYWYTLDDSKGFTWWGCMEHMELFNMKLLRAFDEAGIEFAFPTRTLFLAGDPKRKLAVELAGRD